MRTPAACRGRRGSGHARALALLLAVLTVLGACTPPGLPAVQMPPTASATPSVEPATRSVTIGIGGGATGFNPHSIADFSPVSAAVAALVLPSVSTIAADGTVAFDPALITSARVTNSDPFTVTYTINRAASWSDGTPITAEDFRYLSAEMVGNPGTVDPAGYRLISAIRSRSAGKVVDVEFSAPFPDWRLLFDNLLPAHLAKDAPGGWLTGLTAGLPVSGNRYKMGSFDTVNGEITLERNDKYWENQPGPGSVVLRLGAAADLLAAFGRGDLQAVLVQPDAGDIAELNAELKALREPAASRRDIPLPASTQLVFNTASGPAAAAPIRRAVAAALVPALIRAALGGGREAAELDVTSQIRLPAQPGGSSPVERPPTADRAAAAVELARAGYVPRGLYVGKGGALLHLSLGYGLADPRMASAARLIQQQLGAVGILVDLTGYRDQDLVSAMASGVLDMALVMVPRGPSDAVAAASTFGCGPAAAPGAPRRPGNLAGYCVAGIESVLTAALSGSADVQSADSRLWRDLPVLPLAQPSWTFAVSGALSGVIAGAGPGWLWTGPLAGLSDWPLG